MYPRSGVSLRGKVPAEFRGTSRFQVLRRLGSGAVGVVYEALVHHFIAELTAFSAPPIVLSGRCYERESVPYKAFDGVIDALSKHLGRRDQAHAAAVVPSNARLIAQAPVQQDIVDPVEQRTRMFGALRDLLRNLAKRHPLVVLVDDLQWADADSLALLAEVFRAPDAPPLLLMATLRAGADFDVAEVFPGDVRHIVVSNLPPDRARDWFATQKVVVPERVVRTLAPVPTG